MTSHLRLRYIASWLLVGGAVTLAGCQTTQGPSSFESSFAESAPSKSANPAEIWVDLTPYPKENVNAVALNSSMDDMPDSPQEIGQWAVRHEDGTIRHALQRWSQIAGWSFDNTHYELNVDIPITAEAVLVERGSYRQGVQALVEAVALSDHPIRACFYQNKVLRIVTYNSSCNARLN